MSDTFVKYPLLHQLKSADFHEGNEKKATMSGTSYRIMSGTSDFVWQLVRELSLTPVIYV